MKKSSKEIAIQVHELKPLNFDVHSHAKMAKQAKGSNKKFQKENKHFN